MHVFKLISGMRTCSSQIQFVNLEGGSNQNVPWVAYPSGQNVPWVSCPLDENVHAPHGSLSKKNLTEPCAYHEVIMLCLMQVADSRAVLSRVGRLRKQSLGESMDSLCRRFGCIGGSY